tara:strand:- start:2578 stop:2958 length:381 start_codon:yes stop_codon:yes gene_type:complete
MAYYKPINLVKGDDLPLLEITLRDSNEPVAGTVLSLTDPTTWKPLDLTTMTNVRMKFRKIGTTTPVHTITASRLLPYIDGVVSMAWALTTLDGEAGDYEGEIEITYANAKVLTIADKFKFIVRDQF